MDPPILSERYSARYSLNLDFLRHGIDFLKSELSIHEHHIDLGRNSPSVWHFVHEAEQPSQDHSTIKMGVTLVHPSV